MKSVFITIFLICVCAVSIPAQDTVTITIADLRNFRKAINDALYWEGVATDRQRQTDAANVSASNWEKLFLKEKARADGVQEKRVGEATAAATDFQSANVLLREQNTELKREKRDLEDDVVSLKSSRKWYFGAGAVTGGALGFLGGRQTCGTSIPGIPGLGRPAAESVDLRRNPLYRPLEMPNPLRPAKDFLKLRTQF